MSFRAEWILRPVGSAGGLIGAARITAGLCNFVPSLISPLSLDSKISPEQERWKTAHDFFLQEESSGVPCSLSSCFVCLRPVPF